MRDMETNFRNHLLKMQRHVLEEIPTGCFCYLGRCFRLDFVFRNCFSWKLITLLIYNNFLSFITLLHSHPFEEIDAILKPLNRKIILNSKCGKIKVNRAIKGVSSMNYNRGSSQINIEYQNKDLTDLSHMHNENQILHSSMIGSAKSLLPSSKRWV